MNRRLATTSGQARYSKPNCHFLALLALPLAVARAPAGEPPELATLINRFRSAPQTCEARKTAAVGPLAPDPRLSTVRSDAGHALVEAVKGTGYQPARVQMIELSGPPTAKAAMALLRKRHCEALTNPQFADIGIAHEGNSWRIVLARPLLSPDLGGWREAGKQVLELVNAARHQPRRCGEKRFGKAQPLSWNSKLADAALAHSRDMAERNYFRHEGKGGNTVQDRVNAAGYAWRRVGENIATGQGSPKQVVSAWLASPHHCANIMEPGFTQMAAAYAVNPKSDSGIYWTQVFGARRN